VIEESEGMPGLAAGLIWIVGQVLTEIKLEILYDFCGPSV